MSLRVARAALHANGGHIVLAIDGTPIGRSGGVDAWGLDGSTRSGSYDRLEINHVQATGVAAWKQNGSHVRIEDTWRVVDDGFVLRRVITASAAEGGLQVGLDLALSDLEEARFFVPGAAYSPDQWQAGGSYIYSDSRLAAPLAAAFTGGHAVVLARTDGAESDLPAARPNRESRFLQETDLGSIGFRTGAVDSHLIASWPYYEGDRSPMLDGNGTAASALFPLRTGLRKELEYRVTVTSAPEYASAVASVFRSAIARLKPTPTQHTISLQQSVDLRLDSAAKSYTVNEDDAAGFVLNFDPDRGYESDAKAFGASSTEHSMGGSHALLEYGFTGRQLNLAYRLAQRDPDRWGDRAALVVNTFVERMTSPSGWVHTIWDLAASAPVFACGDPRGTVMHYLGSSAVAGTYTRMMVEAVRDLILNVQLHAGLGRDVSAWRRAAVALAAFFVRTQNEDGSWYRAYAPDGTPIVGSTWFGDRAQTGKSATAAVIPLLLDVASLVEDSTVYEIAAARAGEYVVDHIVDPVEFRGGTLDNPNLVDKEAALLAMRALLLLHEHAIAGEWLARSRVAADIAITWHSIQTVPNLPDTPLGRAGVRSTGWGGINSVWCVGVTDIYSLFFAADLVRLAALTGDTAYALIAELAVHASLELLATPGELHGFADTGMQPEGISFCAEGEDDGLIAKGDTWGGLGWPYTAGTDGVLDYLAAVAAH